MWPATKAGRRHFLALGALSSLAALGAGCRPLRSPRLYRLGLVAPLEGLFRNDGYAALEVCRSAVTEWNATAISRGVQLQVWAVDDGNEPELAATRARELVGDPLILAVIGHATPETSAAGSVLYSQAGLLQVSPTALLGTDQPTGQAVAVSLGMRPTGGAESTTQPADGGLLALALALSESDQPAVIPLNFGYCPEALIRTYPHLGFTAPLQPGRPTLSSLTRAAVERALSALTAALGAGAPLTRATVLRAGLTAAQVEGWTLEGGAYYAPGTAAELVRCPSPPDA